MDLTQSNPRLAEIEAAAARVREQAGIPSLRPKAILRQRFDTSGERVPC